MQDPIQSTRLMPGASAHYSVRLASSPQEIQAAQALRFAVFNLELNEGLQASYATGLDTDPFDAVCDHLIVEHSGSGTLVGTYRLQTGPQALSRLGYYSAQEFDLRPFEDKRPLLVELGRACVHKQHRNLAVLGLLWKGIAEYAASRGCRYLFGCSSLTSQDPAVGAAAYLQLSRDYLADPDWRVDPLPEVACPLAPEGGPSVSIPKLLRAYLSIGARICGAPAIDREFKTIDFLTLLDLGSLPEDVRRRFLE